MSEQTIQLPKALTPQDIKNLEGAFLKLQELLSKKIVEKGDDAEKAGLMNYIGNTMMEHAPVFISCWKLVHTEYVPLVRAVGALLERSSRSHPLTTVPAEEVAK